ncbi:MAG TPA: alpha/beta hydrolase, partial [Bacillota bacterium]
AWAFERFLDRVGQVSCPALVLWGARDRLLPVEHGVAIFKHLQDGRLQVIDDCGHVMPLERPEELAKVLAGFFE